MAATVARLAIVPVKGLRLMAVEEVELTPAGPAGDRAFFVVEADGRLVRTSRTPKLLQIAPRWDGTTLALRLPGGEEVAAAPEPGNAATTRLYDGREIAGRRVEGPLAEALSAHLGRPVGLLAADPGQTGADDFPVSLMSTGSLSALGDPDARRFRMTITIDGVEPFAEHGWAGRELGVGEATLRVVDPVPRCVVTTRDPDDGRADVPILERLAALRGPRDVTFGVWCEVASPGRVRVGDALSV